LTSNWILILVIIFTIFARFYKLGWDESNDDASFWFGWSKKLIDNWKNGVFSTMPDYQYPGVTLMASTGLFLNIAGFVVQALRGYKFPIYDANYFPIYNFFAKVPIEIAYLAFSGYFFIGLKKVFNRRIALLALFLLVAEPFNLGITRFVHAEGYLSAFVGTLFISYLLFLKTKRCRYLFLFSLFSALALVTKYISAYPLFVIYMHLLAISIRNKKILLFIYSLVGIGAFTLAFFPALVLNPINTFLKMKEEVVMTALVGRNNFAPWYFYIASMFLRFSIIFSFCYVWGIRLGVRKIKQGSSLFTLLTLPTVTIISFVIFLSFFNQKIDRYLITIFPIMATLIAYILNDFLESIKRTPIKRSVILMGGFYYLFLFISISPTYSAYYNKLYGGFVFARKYLGAEMVGEGLYKVAEDLNTKNNPEDLSVLVRPTFTSFKPFFKGKTFGPSDYIPDSISLDYIVVKNSDRIPDKYINLCSFNKTYYLYFSPVYDLYQCQ